MVKSTRGLAKYFSISAHLRSGAQDFKYTWQSQRASGWPLNDGWMDGRKEGKLILNSVVSE